MFREKCRTWLPTALAMVIVISVGGQALASTHDFSWSGWRGGDHDSGTWGASGSGTHQWVKTECRAVAAVSGGHFGVEIRRVRSFAPDVSLGTQDFYCDNGDRAASYHSGSGGAHKFRFPYVDRGDLDGITGSGHVNYPG